MKRLLLSMCMAATFVGIHAADTHGFMARISTNVNKGFDDFVSKGTSDLLRATTVVAAGVVVAEVYRHGWLNRYFPKTNCHNVHLTSESSYSNEINNLQQLALTSEAAMRTSLEKDGADSELYKAYYEHHQLNMMALIAAQKKHTAKRSPEIHESGNSSIQKEEEAPA